MDGVHQGFKKIYMLYLNRTNGEKPEKTDWVLHQYHAYTDERESEHEGEIVVSKLYCDVNSKHSALQACELDQVLVSVQDLLYWLGKQVGYS